MLVRFSFSREPLIILAFLSHSSTGSGKSLGKAEVAGWLPMLQLVSKTTYNNGVIG